MLVAHESPRNFGKNYMVDVNNIVASANLLITSNQNVLGLIANVNNESRVYFANFSLGNSVTARNNDHSAQARKYLVNRVTKSFNLNEVLRKAGAKVVTNPPEGEYCDLSPQALDKSVIIDLITPKGDK